MPVPFPSDEAAREAQRARTLLEITNAVISNLTQETLFRAVALALRRVVPFDRTAIFLHDPEKDVLRLVLLEGTLPSPRFVLGLEMDARDSPPGRVHQARRAVLRSDLDHGHRSPVEEAVYADGIRSLVIVPLVTAGRSLGTLNLVSRTPGQYTEADGAFLQEVAGQVALAIANMKAYEEIAALKARLERENVYLREEIRGEHNLDEIVGNSPSLLAVLRRVAQAAPTDATVIILGETGTGKEMIARTLHERSARRSRPLVKVNCSAISAGLVESELFGHVKGAFTGAIERRVGRFELADGGTIFLDEVGDLPLETQVKLLRVLQEREFEPVGSSRTQRVDVRVLAATNRDLEEAVRLGRFRADLFYRLNVVPIVMPPLRERREDIPQLVTFFVARFARAFGRTPPTVPARTMEPLTRYAWPGNVRELQNVIERAVVLSSGPELELDPATLSATAGRAPGPATGDETRSAGDLATVLAETERDHILGALRRSGWVIEGARGAARLLGLHPNTLRSRMQKLGIARSTHDGS